MYMYVYVYMYISAGAPRAAQGSRKASRDPPALSKATETAYACRCFCTWGTSDAERVPLVAIT